MADTVRKSSSNRREASQWRPLSRLARSLGTYGAPEAPFWTTILNQISYLASYDARISPRDVRRPISSRPVNATDAAAYLGYASTEVLKHLPIKPIQLNIQGPGSAPRWDLRAIDEMLDASSGLEAPDSVNDNDYDSPKALLGAWRAKRGR